MNFSILFASIERFLEKQKPYLWILLYLSFIYILSGTLFFEICVGLKVFRYPEIYLKCSFFFKVLFKISCVLTFYSTLSPFLVILGFSKQLSKTLFFDFLLALLWGGMSFFVSVLYYFYDGMYAVWGGEVLRDLFERAKKVIALSPDKSSDSSSTLIDPKDNAKKLSDESLGFTVSKKKESGRTRLFRLVPNTGLSFEDGSELKVFKFRDEKLTIGIAKPCIAAEEFEKDSWKEQGCGSFGKCIGSTLMRSVVCVADFSSSLVGVVISRPSTPEFPDLLSPVQLDASGSESAIRSPLIQSPFAGFSKYFTSMSKANEVLGETCSVKSSLVEPISSETKGSDFPSPGQSPSEGATNLYRFFDR